MATRNIFKTGDRFRGFDRGVVHIVGLAWSEDEGQEVIVFRTEYETPYRLRTLTVGEFFSKVIDPDTNERVSRFKRLGKTASCEQKESGRGKK